MIDNPVVRGGADPGDEVEEAEARFSFFARLVADHCHDAIVVTDLAGRTEWVNAAFRASTGYALEELRGQKPGDLLQGAETDPAAVRAISEALAERRPIRTEILNYTKAGTPYWVEMSISPVFDADGRQTHFIAVERDVTERRELEERTRAVFEAEEFQQSERKLLSEMSEWLYSAKSQDELLAVVELSMRTLMPESDGALYVYAPERDTLTRAAHWGDVPAPEHVAADECWSLRRGRAYYYGGQTIQLPCGHLETARYPAFCLPIVAQGETIGLMHLAFPAFSLDVPGDAHPHAEFLRQRWSTAITCAEQISLAIANVRLRDELEARSVHDQLTGLKNRRWFLEAGAQILRRSLSAGAPCALVALDVDHFKGFNDRFGHDAGDAVLAEVATAMTAEVAASGVPCRIGGEEFAVILPETDAAAAIEAADAIRLRIGGLQLRHHGRELPRLTVSAGVALGPEAGATIPALLKAADRALYAAKNAGRDRVTAASDLPAGARGDAPAAGTRTPGCQTGSPARDGCEEAGRKRSGKARGPGSRA